MSFHCIQRTLCRWLTKIMDTAKCLHQHRSTTIGWISTSQGKQRAGRQGWTVVGAGGVTETIKATSGQQDKLVIYKQTKCEMPPRRLPHVAYIMGL